MATAHFPPIVSGTRLVKIKIKLPNTHKTSNSMTPHAIQVGTGDWLASQTRKGIYSNKTIPIMVRMSGLPRPKNWLIGPAANTINNPLKPENVAFPSKARCKKDFFSIVS